MVKVQKLVRLGFCNKKLILPFGVAFFQILINIMNLLFDEEQRNSFLESLDSALSQMAIVLIPFFLKYSFQTTSSIIPRRSRAKNFLHFFYLYLIFCCFLALNIIKTVLFNKYIQQQQTENKNYQNHQNTDLSSFESLELIFICIVSIILLKYKYFIHHIISIAIFAAANIFIDLIIGNFPDLLDRGIVFILLSIIIVAIDAIDYGYQKYMMDILYHPFWMVTFTLGLANFTVYGFFIIFCLAIGKQKALEGDNKIILFFFRYFEEVSVGIIITKHLLNFILNIFLNLFLSLTILYFSPDFILISFTISRMLDIIIGTKKYICIIFFVLQFITLMFHLEIFEFNFCGLNKNTRKRIREREARETYLSVDENRESNASDTYIIHNNLIDINENYQTYDVSTEKNKMLPFIHEIEMSSEP